MVRDTPREDDKMTITKIDTEAELIAAYEAWNKANGLNLGSADEHLFDESLTQAQREWLRVFCERWDAMLEANPAAMTPAKYPNEVEPFAIETQASVARWNKLQRVTRERDELIEALRDLVRRCDGDEGVRSDGSNIDTLAAHIVLVEILERKSA
jgi:hypothetical protein